MARIDIDLQLNQGNVRQGLQQVQRQVSRTSGVFDSFLGNLTANVFQSFAAGAVSAFGDIFRSAIQIEMVSAQFRVLTGDAETAERALASVSEFAAGTPFDNPSVERAATQLLAFGTTAGQLNERLTDLGNIAGVANAGIDELATIFGQVNAQGRLTAERFNQLAERGINLGNALAEQLGVPVSQLRDEISAGRVSADAFNEAIGNLGDQFMGIGALSMTLGGAISTLGSQFELLRRNIGGEFVAILTEVINSMASFLAIIQPVVRELTRLVVTRVVTFFRELIVEFQNGRTVLNTLAVALRENRATIIRVAAAYGIYLAAVTVARVTTIAWGAALTLVSPILFLIRNRTIIMSTAVMLATRIWAGLARFFTVVWPAAVAIATSPITLIIAALGLFGAAVFALRDRLTLGIATIGQSFTEFGIRTANLGIAIERAFRSIGATIIEAISPAIMFITRNLADLIRRIPATFRPQALTNFANELDGIDLRTFAMGIRMGESGLVGFRNELLETRNGLRAVGNTIREDLGDQTVFQELSSGFGDLISRLRELATNNPVVTGLTTQFNEFKETISDITPDGLASFVSSGQSLISGLLGALQSGQIPAALTDLIGSNIAEIQNGIRMAEDAAATADRNAAEGFDSGRNRLRMNEMQKTAIVVMATKDRSAQIEALELQGSERRILVEESERLRQLTSTQALNAEDIAMAQAQADRIANIQFDFARRRAELITDAGQRDVAEVQARENRETTIVRNAARARMQIKAAEVRSSMGLQTALSNLISAGLMAEGVGVRERKGLAIAQATINAYAGASRAFVDYPYPASAAVAASVIATGLVQVHNITSTGNFQNGGIIPGNSFSGDRLTANVNSGELILNRSQQGSVASQLMQSQDLSVDMDARLANIEELLSRPTIIQNADGRMFAEIARQGVRDGVDLNG